MKRTMKDIDLDDLKEWIKEIIREAENDEIYDVRRSLYSLFKHLGGKVKVNEWGEYYIEEEGE